MGMLLGLLGLFLHSHLPCACLEAKPFSEPLELIRKTRNSIHNFNYRDKKLDERHNPMAPWTQHHPRTGGFAVRRGCRPATARPLRLSTTIHAHRIPSPFS